MSILDNEGHDPNGLFGNEGSAYRARLATAENEIAALKVELATTRAEVISLTNYNTGMDKIGRELEVERDRLMANLQMIEGTRALGTIGIDAHAITVQVSKETMAKLIKAEVEIAALKVERDRLREALEQIAIVCTDNMDQNCEHRMALDFVRQVANDANEQKAGDGNG